METLGYCKGDKCNREGCVGIIDEHEKEGSCSCHINPPCDYCVTSTAFCPVCGYDAEEEQREIDNANMVSAKTEMDYWKKEQEKWHEQYESFMAKYRGEIVATELEIRKESHSSSSMRVLGVHPKGFDLTPEMDRIRGTFGGRFVMKGETRFEYIAYTD